MIYLSKIGEWYKGEEMEKRTLKILISKPAGTAGENSIGYKISLPTSWIDAMGITLDDQK